MRRGPRSDRAQVSFLDEKDRGGWKLLQALVDCHDVRAAGGSSGGATAAALLESDWLKYTGV